MNINFAYQRLTPEYKSQVIDLLKHLWKFDIKIRYKYFKWKFEDNPYLKELPCFIALHKNKVVAFRGCFITPMRKGENFFLSAQIGDMVTHPNYRRKRLFQNLTEFAISQLKNDNRIICCCVSSSGGPTLGGNINLGFYPLSEREHIFRFTFRGVLGLLLQRAPQEDKKNIIEDCNSHRKIIITNECRAREMCAMLDKAIQISHYRDIMFYQWRFSNPINSYKFAYLFENDKLCAYISFLNMGKGRYDILDFNYIEEKDLKRLLNFFSHKIRPFYLSLWTVNKVNVIYCHKLKYGFISFKHLLYMFKKFVKPPFLVKQVNATSISTKLYFLSEWNLFKIIGDEI